jgi:hypothetical protein
VIRGLSDLPDPPDLQDLLELPDRKDLLDLLDRKDLLDLPVAFNAQQISQPKT